MGCHKSAGWTPEEGVAATGKVAASPASHLHDEGSEKSDAGLSLLPPAGAPFPSFAAPLAHQARANINCLLVTLCPALLSHGALTGSDQIPTLARTLLLQPRPLTPAGCPLSAQHVR